MPKVLNEEVPLLRATENAGWVKRRHDGSPDAREFPTVSVHHPEPSLPGHGPDGRQAEGHDDSARMRVDVAHESPTAGDDGRDPGSNWVRLAGHRVRDEDVPFVEVSLAERLVQDATRWPPERLSLGDLRRARSLADNDDATRRIATGPDGRAELAVRTADAVVDGRHGASVAPPWRRLRPEWRMGRPRLMEGVWAIVGREGLSLGSGARVRSGLV